MQLSDKYPFLTDYIKSSVNNPSKKLFHSLLFYGTDLNSQYILALETARLLNCKYKGEDDCQCINCKWIRESVHPAVLTISKKDNKPLDDNSTTVISVKQSEMIGNSLLKTSEFHRVFIFCDKDNDGNIKGLNRMNLQDAAANSLLKIIEEPPEDVTFIFLTQNKNDLLHTIISRSQCFFVPSKIKPEFHYNLVEDVIKNYWEIRRADAFDFSEKLCTLANEYSLYDILEQMQNYMLFVLKQNIQSEFLINDIKAAEYAKKEVRLGMKNDIILDELCLKLIRAVR